MIQSENTDPKFYLNHRFYTKQKNKQTKLHILITSIIDIEKTPSSRLHQFIEYLLENGHKITLISLKDNWKHKGEKLNQELIKKIDIIYINEKNAGAIVQKSRVPFIYKKLLKKVNGKIDVHFCYNSIVLGYYVTRAMKNKNIKTIYDLADDIPEMIKQNPQMPNYLRTFSYHFSRLMLRKVLDLSDFITYTAKEFENSLNLKNYENRILLPNGVNSKMFTPKQKKTKNFTVGYLGAIREWVNLRPLFDAIKNLEEFKIKLLIVGGENDLEQSKKYVKKLKIEELVKFTGNVPFSKIPDYISKMDVTTVPFKKNAITNGTCPLKLLEYMSCEKTTICTPLNEIKNMVNNRVLYAKNPKEWEKHISMLFQDKILCENIGKNGREFIIANYSWNKICKTIENTLMLV